MISKSSVYCCPVEAATDNSASAKLAALFIPAGTVFGDSVCAVAFVKGPLCPLSLGQVVTPVLQNLSAC